MIYTLTLNTAIDLNLTCEHISPDKVNRVSQTNYSPNGKAVNVSIVLEHFGLKSVAMGIFGGFTGQYILDCLEKRGIQTLPFFIEDITRINVFVNDKEKEYKFVGKGGHVSHLTQQAILNSVNEITDMECLIISGSLPPGIDASFLEQLSKSMMTLETLLLIATQTKL
ncbi:hypothetical protein CW613_001054 [Vibrio mimicus]|uniref:1-phosphofructokinase family hexose kinase n=1 Tax=Vibrio mimicus TaxID=674 RepID=UPI002F93F062